MKPVILGTAGHIDHGKTSLVKALTGTNTDRLKEEQTRGITIELGFTYFDLPNKQILGVVDVPGHEKFIKNMVAGATGIDILIMIIAADEGVMPQTREHLDICSLLDIKYGLIVLTKIDLVNSDWIELVEEEIKDFVKNTFLEKSPIIHVSSKTRKGLDVLTKLILEVYNKIPMVPTSDIFRLPVDRVFTMRGFGTVVTGTIISGKIKVGDTIMIYPNQVKSKIRGLQVHNKKVLEAKAGMRTAINFQGLEITTVKRGDIIAINDTLNNSYMVDVYLKFLKSNIKPIKNRTKIRFHTGTSEIMGNIIFIDREHLLPGETCFAQVRLESPVSIVKDDRFVIRSYSPIRTIGGGRILNPIPRKHKRFQEKTMLDFQTMQAGSPDAIIEYHVRVSEINGISFNELVIATRISTKILRLKIALKLSNKKILKISGNNDIYIHIDTFNLITKKVKGILKKYHEKYPLKAGISKEELRSQFPFDIKHRLFTTALGQMSKNTDIIIENDLVKLANHSVKLGKDQEIIKKQILKLYQKEQLTPPYFKDIAKKIDVSYKKLDPILELLLKERILLKIKEGLFYHKDTIYTLEQNLRKFLEKNGEITTPQFKDMTQISRKYLIPLIEYFDSAKVTIRIGDIRRLR